MTRELHVKELTSIKKEMKDKHRSLMVKKFRSNKLALTGAIILTIIIISAIFFPLFISSSPYELDTVNRLQAPSPEHIFGTDNYGRDLLSRVIYGARVSLVVGFSVALLTALLGTIMGLYSAYYKRIDGLLMRISDGLMAFPAILLAIAIMASLGANTTNVIIALTIVFSPLVARTIRSASLVIKEQTYIEALKAQGASTSRIIWSNIFPNIISPLIVQATFIFADSIIVEAALSFLGAGIPAPAPSWGNLLYDGKTVIFNAWWMTLFPGLAIMLTVFGLNLFGDGLRDLLDPHSKSKK